MWHDYRPLNFDSLQLIRNKHKYFTFPVNFIYTNLWVVGFFLGSTKIEPVEGKKNHFHNTVIYYTKFKHIHILLHRKIGPLLLPENVLTGKQNTYQCKINMTLFLGSLIARNLKLYSRYPRRQSRGKRSLVSRVQKLIKSSLTTT